MTDDHTKDPRRLTVVLNDPSAEWAEIRSALRAKAQGGGACTNHAVMKTLSSARKPDDDKQSSLMHAAEKPMKNHHQETVSGDDDGQAAKEVSGRSGSENNKLMPLGGNVNRRSSLKSQKSGGSNNSQRYSRRSLFRREASRRRSSQSSQNRRSSQSILSDCRSTFSSGKSIRSGGSSFANSQFFDSVNIMDFGVSQRALAASLDESCRSFASLDDNVLDELEEELYEDGNEGGGGGAGRGRSSRGLLVSWQHNDCGIDESTRSEGDLDDMSDSCDFLDWPSVDDDNGNGTIEEEPQVKKEEVEEWNIEDYEQNQSIDDSVRSRSLHQSLTKKFNIFGRSSFTSSVTSTSSAQEGDLFKIKQSLLNTKNKHQEAEDGNYKKRRASIRSMGPLSSSGSALASSITSILRMSSTSEVGETTKRTSQEAIWVRDSEDEGDQYRNLYAPTSPKPPQRKGFFSKGEA
eukprot:scaffold4399_cov75-Skeletonema_dohrnii-CCMP3373.AAC.5